MPTTRLKAILDADVAGFERGIDRAEDSLEDLAQVGNTTGKEFETTNSRISASFDLLKGAIIGAISAFSVNALADGTTAVIRANAEINLLSQSLNVSKAALTTWGTVGKKAGIDIADVFKDVSEKMGEFAEEGTGEAAFVFQRLNLDINEMIGLAPDEMLLRVAEAMNALPDLSQSAKISILERLGNDATKLLPFLEDNAAELREIQRITAESGAIISEEQNEILETANQNLTQMEIALDGVQNVAATMGAELLNAVSGNVVDGLLKLDDLIITIRHDVVTMAQAWGFALNQAGDDTERFTAEQQKEIDQFFEYFRVGMTYLPVITQAAYSAIGDYGESWGFAAAAQFDRVQSSAQEVFANIIDFGGGAFGTLNDIAGNTVAFIIRRFADMVGGIGSTLSTVGSYIGFDEAGSGFAQTEQGLRGIAEQASKTGDAVRTAFAAQANSMREAALANAEAALQNQLYSEQAKSSALNALAQAEAFTHNSEAQRTLNREMALAERQFNALGQSTETASKAGRDFYVNQEAVNKALIGGSSAAAKAATASKAKADADKEAAKAAQKYAREQERAAKKAEREAINAAKAQARQLAQSEKAQERAARKAAREFERASREQARQLAQAAKTREREQEKAEREALRAAKAQARQLAQAQKAQERDSAKQAREQQREADKQARLAARATEAAKREALRAAKEQARQLAQAQKEQQRLDEAQAKQDEKKAKKIRDLAFATEKLRMEATLTADEYRRWQLINEEGLTPSLADAQQAMEKQAEQLVQSKELSGEFGDIINDHVLGSLKGLVDTGNDLLDSLINKLLETVLTGEGLGNMFAGLGGGAGGAGIFDSLLGGIGSLFGFQNGGSFNVGGSGGTDSQLVAFRASPNERVTIQTPQQVQQAQGSAVNISYNPILNVSGGADEAMVRRVVGESQRDFSRQIRPMVNAALAQGGSTSVLAGMRT